MAWLPYASGMGPHDPITLIGAGRPDDPGPGAADVMARMAVRNAPAQTVLARRLDFERRHPAVTIRSPLETSSRCWEADWPDKDGEYATHADCAVLLDYLEARFDRGDLRDT